MFLAKEVSAIVEIFAFDDWIDGWAAYYNRDPVRLPCQPLDRLFALPDKIIELKKISRWIATDGEFGETYDICFLAFCFGDSFNHLAYVAVEVADVVIELC